LNITALACYLIVCDTKNFTQAAKKCYISPQGVSKTIKKLEQELGCQLFYRTHQGLELTESGAALQIRAQNIVEEASLLREDLAQIAGRHHKIGLGIAMGTLQVMGRSFIEQIQELLVIEGLTSVDSMDLMCESEVAAQRYEQPDR
jgi:DNA-binding transcriptional LysR family regulator